MKRRAFTLLSVSTVCSGIAGCLGGRSEDDSDDAETNRSDGSTEGDSDDTATSESGERTEEDSDEADSDRPIWLDEDGSINVVDTDWGVEATHPDDPSDFRSWLNGEQPEPETNLRFDYTHGYDPNLFETVPDFVDYSEENIEGTLIQRGNLIYLGTFDVDTILENLADADEHERTGERGEFTIVDERIAIGPNTVIVGGSPETLEIPLAVYEGERDPLEAVDPAFTRLLQELPDDHTVAGQYGQPLGVGLDVDGLYVTGIAHPPGELPQGQPIETTWVFLFPDDADLTEETLSELETIATTVDRSEIDGRVARVEGELGRSG